MLPQPRMFENESSSFANSLPSLWFLILCKICQNPAPETFGHLTNNKCSLSIIILCRIHLDLLEQHAYRSGNNNSSPLSVGSFHQATRRTYEFGDLTVETLDTVISSPEDPELEELHSSQAGMSLGELDCTLPEIEPLNFSENSYSILNVCCCFQRS